VYPAAPHLPLWPLACPGERILDDQQVTLLKRARLPQIRFQDLRHTCATLLLSRNVHPKYVQELLGHASIAITLDTYSHAIPGMGTYIALNFTRKLRVINRGPAWTRTRDLFLIREAL
jgi:integrase